MRIAISHAANRRIAVAASNATFASQDLTLLEEFLRGSESDITAYCQGNSLTADYPGAHLRATTHHRVRLWTSSTIY